MHDDERRAGLEMFRAMLPGLLPDGDDVSLNSPTFAGEMGDLALHNAFATLWTRPGLDRRSRSLVTLGALIALGVEDELSVHMRVARANGLSVDEIAEVVYHMTAYAGFPAAMAARRVGAQIFDAAPDTDATATTTD